MKGGLGGRGTEWLVEVSWTWVPGHVHLLGPNHEQGERVLGSASWTHLFHRESSCNSGWAFYFQNAFMKLKSTSKFRVGRGTVSYMIKRRLLSRLEFSLWLWCWRWILQNTCSYTDQMHRHTQIHILTLLQITQRSRHIHTHKKRNRKNIYIYVCIY